jgi:hypothetical protein
MKLITTINDAHDAMTALNQNFNMLVTGKRKILEAKEVNNSIGKMINLAKAQVMDAIRTGNTDPITWLSPSKQIGNS